MNTLEQNSIVNNLISYSCSNDNPNPRPSVLGNNGLGTTLVQIFAHNLGFMILKESQLNKVKADLQKCLNTLTSPIDFSYCEGLSGLCLFLNLIDESDEIHFDLDELNSSLKTPVHNFAKFQLNNGNYDNLYGVFGTILYLINCHKECNYTRQIVFELVDSAKRKNGLRYWDNNYAHKNYNKEIVELGLAHGISGKINVLSKICETYPEQESLKECLSDACQYVMNNFKDRSSNFFPTVLENEIESIGNSRLAWCNGDLSVAISLYNAGKVLGQNSLQEVGEHIFTASLNRTSFEETGVSDPAICHGTSGIALLFNRMYLNTGNRVFLDKSKYWLETGINSLKITKKRGVRFELGDHNKSLDNSLLTGFPGILLAAISILSRKEYNWDKFLFLH